MSLCAERHFNMVDNSAPAILCIHCGYDLRGIAAEGNCPECGTAIEISLQKERWRSFMATARLAEAMDLMIIASLLALIVQLLKLSWLVPYINPVVRSYFSFGHLASGGMILLWPSAWFLAARLEPKPPTGLLNLPNLLRISATAQLVWTVIPSRIFLFAPLALAIGGVIQGSLVITYYLRLLRLGHWASDHRLIQHAPILMIIGLCNILVTHGVYLVRGSAVTAPEYVLFSVVGPIVYMIYRLVIMVHGRRIFWRLAEEAHRQTGAVPVASVSSIQS